MSTIPSVRTEYLSDSGGWGDKKHARVFATHGLADEVAARQRHKLKEARRIDGTVTAAFVHARVLELSEREEFQKRAARKATKERRPTIEQEMQADDLRELEEVEVYG